jgi:hypothetical protein
MSEILDGGPPDSRRAWAGRGLRRRPQGYVAGVGLLVGAAALASVVSGPTPLPSDPMPPPVLSVVGGQVSVDSLGQTAVISLVVLNTGPATLLDRIDGLPEGLLFVPPRGGLTVAGGSSTRLPLAWPGIDCAWTDDELTRAAEGAGLVLREARASPRSPGRRRSWSSSDVRPARSSDSPDRR